MKLRQFDTVHLTGTVEIALSGGAQVIIKGPTGAENRVQVATSEIVHCEPGPLRAGDVVAKTIPAKGKAPATKIEGMVKHRDRDLCWVGWADGTDSVEDANGLDRG